MQKDTGDLLKYIEQLKNLFIKAHSLIIKFSGGEEGIRCESTLQIITERIVNKISREELPINIARFCLKEFATRHCFCDGNKRSAFLFTYNILWIFGLNPKIKYPDFLDNLAINKKITGYSKEVEEFIIEIARKSKTDSEIKNFIEKVFF